MTAGLVDRAGAFGGQLSGPNQYNPKGMFENAQIRDRIVKGYLRSIGVDPKGQWPLPDPNHLAPWMGLRREIEDVMVGEGYKKGPWYYKGAKVCLIWPLWAAHFPDARWVIVRRAKEEIINSCIRTGFMRAFKDEQGWGVWVDHHLWCFDQIKRACGDRVYEFWPKQVIEGDYGAAEALLHWLGLRYNKSSVEAFVEKKFWHG